MWIATCDDERAYLDNFSSVLSSVAAPDDYISIFQTGFELLDTAYKAKHPYDLLFLDMEMPGLDGIESARELRRICPNTIIIVLTNYMKYALKCYEIHAFDYLIKPVSHGTLINKIGEARNITQFMNTGSLLIRTRQDSTFLSFVDILYIESCGKELCAHTRNKKHHFFRAISDLAEAIEDKGFMRVHKSYIVNLSHVKQLNKENGRVRVLMSSGVWLPVGDRKVKALTSAIIDLKG